ncbi:MAG: zinc-binding alcohol dehydrogenase [Spiribacter sp.]|nr:zinc-binding alcohol dehydrogenase [Spiribacter sp.]MDR9454870.1 zinc-binding alcohol dehydrogenase [Spiribacter sp.]
MSEPTSQAFWITQPGHGEIQSSPLPDLPAGWVQVRTLFSGISRGTEALVWQGRVPASQSDRMRAPRQMGEFPGPVKYGYSNVGVIEKGPGQWIGQTVFCLHPHETRYQAPLDQVHLLPPGLDPARAVLAANVETAINGCWDAMPRIGERITVIGAGVVGTLTAALCHAVPGVQLELVDTNPERESLARALGLPFVTPATATPGVDQVIHASGSEAGLDLALRLGGDEAAITELSWYGDQPVSVPLGSDFHPRRLTLRSSQVGQIAPDMRPRWDTGRRLGLALHLLATHSEWAVLIDGESPFEALPRTMASVANGHGLCHRIRYEE